MLLYTIIKALSPKQSSSATIFNLFCAMIDQDQTEEIPIEYNLYNKQKHNTHNTKLI